MASRAIREYDVKHFLAAQEGLKTLEAEGWHILNSWTGFSGPMFINDKVASIRIVHATVLPPEDSDTVAPLEPMLIKWDLNWFMCQHESGSWGRDGALDAVRA